MAETTATVVAPLPGTDEYNNAMADKYRAAQEGRDDIGSEVGGQDVPPVTPAANVTAMPDGGYEKFYDAKTGAYNWQNHAVELQYRLEQVKKGLPAEEKPADKPPVTPAKDDEVKDILAKAGLSETDIVQQIVQSGNITPESRAALIAQGIPASLIDATVDNANYRLTAERASSLAYCGGEEEWAKISAWSAANLPEGEKAELNRILATPGWKLGVDMMRSRMGAAKPTSREGALEGFDSASGRSSASGYRSRDDMKADMRNPLYKTSASFREQVGMKMQSASWDLDSRL